MCALWTDAAFILFAGYDSLSSSPNLQAKNVANVSTTFSCSFFDLKQSIIVKFFGDSLETSPSVGNSWAKIPLEICTFSLPPNSWSLVV